jgi:hypothetical protein
VFLKVLDAVQGPVRAVNPGYVLFLGAAVALLSLVFPWAILKEPPHDPPVSIATIPTVAVTGWQLGGIPILLIGIALAGCAYLFIRRSADLRTKIVLISVVLAYGLVAIGKTNSVISHLARSRAVFGESPTDGSGPGIGMLLNGVAVIALIVGTVLAIGWIPGYTATPPLLWKQSHDS